MKNSKIITIVIVVAVVVGALSFYGGEKYSQSTTPVRSSSTLAASGGRQFGGARAGGAAFGAGGGAVNGTVIGKDNQSITVSLMQGGSQIIFFSPSTTVDKTTIGTINDVATGTRVMVLGTSNSDGTETAQSIQLRPAGATGSYTGTGRPATAPSAQ